MAPRSIVDVGKFLQRYGLNIGENPAFGGVGSGHSPTGYHPAGLAIDVRDWRPDMAPAYKGGEKKHWKQRTGELSWRAKQLGVFNEALGPGDKGHDTHVHLALEGNKPISDQQLEWLATGRYKNPAGQLTSTMPAPPALDLPEGNKNQNEQKNDKLLAELLGKEDLIQSVLQSALARRNTSTQAPSPLQAGIITPEQAMRLFA
jgi:hypothetical protein